MSKRREREREAYDLAAGAIGSLLWLVNNLGNAGAPSFAAFEAAARADAARALDALEALGVYEASLSSALLHPSSAA